jgi:hypothetical protein
LVALQADIETLAKASIVELECRRRFVICGLVTRATDEAEHGAGQYHHAAENERRSVDSIATVVQHRRYHEASAAYD